MLWTSPHVLGHHCDMPYPKDEDEEDVFEYDPEAAEDGWTALVSNRAAVGSTPLPSLDLASVAILGLRAARRLLVPETRAPFEAQLPQFFDPAILDRLGPAAWAVWYGETRRRTLEATSSGGKLSVKTLERSTDVKQRMLRVVSHALGEHPKAGREVESIRAGRGFADLGQDLVRLAGLYEKYRKIVEKDGLYYDAADVSLAKSLAGQILFEMGESQTQELTELKGELAQAFVVLRQDYDTVRRYAAAFWNDDDYFPSLYTTGPSSRSSSKKSSDTDPGSSDPTPAPVTPVPTDAR